MKNTRKSTAEIFAAIVDHLSSSKKARVVVRTAYRATAYGPKHVTMFRLTQSGDIQAQNGRSWNTIADAVIGPLVSIQFATKG